MVTRRLWPLLVEGRVVHQIGLPFHWGFAGEVVGDNANDLTSLVADPNVSMHEAKAFTCQVYAGRRGGPAPKPTEAPAPWPTARAGAGHADRGAARREIRPWRLERRSWPRFPRAETLLVACRCSWNASSSLSAARLALSRVSPPGSTPTRPSASAARRARSRASSGTSCPRTGSSWSGNSYDNTGELSATSWRHVKFIEQFPGKGVTGAPGPTRRRDRPLAHDERRLQALRRRRPARRPVRPGAIIRNEFDNVYIQPDICNGCALLHRRLPVRRDHPQHHRRPRPQVHALLRPAEATAWCPPAPRPARPSRSSSARSTSCGSGPGSGSRSCTSAGVTDAYLYGDVPGQTYSELNSFYLLVDRPSVYGLPETPVNPWLAMKGDYLRAVLSGLLSLAVLLAALVLGGART